jgi:hypothetical protein
MLKKDRTLIGLIESDVIDLFENLFIFYLQPQNI